MTTNPEAHHAAPRVLELEHTSYLAPHAGVVLVPREVCPDLGERVELLDEAGQRAAGVVGRFVDDWAVIWV